MNDNSKPAVAPHSIALFAALLASCAPETPAPLKAAPSEDAGFNATDLGKPVAEYYTEIFERRLAVGRATRAVTGGVRCELQGSEAEGSQLGGLVFPGGGREVLLDLELPDPDKVISVFVEGRDADNKPVVKWRWDLKKAAAKTVRAQHRLQSQPTDSPFVSVLDDAAAIASTYVAVRIQPASSTSFVVHALASKN